MFTVNIDYDVSKRTLKDATGHDHYCIATIGDNNRTKLQFNVIDTDGELQGFSGRVEFDIQVKDSNESYKPYLPLEQDDSVTLTDEIVRSARRSVLPIQLVYQDDNGHIFASFNMLKYTIANAVN